MNSRIIIAALVAMLAAAAAPAFIGGGGGTPGEAASALGDDPRVGLCEPRCGPRPDRQAP